MISTYLFFSSEESQTIVNTLLRGYRNHINDRIQKSKELRVSGAFAWTKGNFLDSALADSECFESWRKQKQVILGNILNLNCKMKNLEIVSLL